MEQPFIYKYRPEILNDFEMDSQMTDLLKTFITIDNLNLLFVGSCGCGKTSLIKCIIKEYYNGINDSANILIINALKDQGISYYRSDVKTFCQTMSSIPNKKKFIVLDDIDNINEQSQQVFRNCIDKYRNNVNFIATCSNIQKVIDSYQSRVTILKINVLNIQQIEKIIQKICNEENILITNEAKKFILSISDNSIRILINYLEKFKLLKLPINLQLAHQVCTNILFIDFDKFTSYCKNNDINTAIKIIFEIYNQGFSVMDILDNYFIYIKLTNSIDEDLKFEIIKIICTYITIFHIVHEDEIELSLFTNNIISVFNK